MKVYLVTSGEYSDYGITAAFASHELAEEAILKEMKPQEREKWAQTPEEHRWTRIEEYEVLESTDKIEFFHAWNDIYNKFHVHPQSDYVALVDLEDTVRVNPAPKHIKKNHIWVNSRSMDKERALKIARDAHAKAKAEAAGL